MQLSLLSSVVIIIISVFVFIIIMFLARRLHSTKLEEAEKLADKIIQEAKKEAETYKRSAILEAKEEIAKKRETFEKEFRQRRNELSAMEHKLAEKEINLERKSDLIQKKEKELLAREKEIEEKEKQIELKMKEYEELVAKENEQLERIAGMTAEEAKKKLVENMVSEAEHEASQIAKQIRERAIENANKEARNIIAQAIQRCATDHVVETTVSVVSLPNDEMKGRIIGREGRNIRAFENITGIEVIVDDTPEAVTLSGFDPIRREIARIALEKLVQDGRIHPTRIEEVVNKTREEMEEMIKTLGEEAVLEVGVAGLHPDLIRLLGKLHYRTSYGQNVLQHSKEVAYLAKIMASELGLDTFLAKRAGLLHDIGKAMDQSAEGNHAILGAELLKKYGEPEEVVNAVAAHHEDVEPTTPIAILIQAADAISSARPGARRETLEAYIERLENLEKIASSFEGIEKSYAIQAGREIRIIVEPEQISDFKAQELASQIARKIEQELKYPGQIKVTVIRETRAIEYAK